MIRPTIVTFPPSEDCVRFSVPAIPVVLTERSTLASIIAPSAVIEITVMASKKSRQLQLKILIFDCSRVLIVAYTVRRGRALKQTETKDNKVL